MMADSKEQKTEDLPSEVPSPGEQTEPETSNRQDSEESSQKTEPQTSKASETEPELVVESTSFVVPTLETVSRTDASSPEEAASGYINAITRTAREILQHIRSDSAWSACIGGLAIVGGVCLGLAAVFVTFAVTLLCAGISLLFAVCTACGIRFFMTRSVQSSGSEQMLLEGGLRQSPNIEAPVVEQPPSSLRSSSQFSWSSINTSVMDALRGLMEQFGPRQEEPRGEHQPQSRRARIYQDPPTQRPEVIFERGIAAASSSSAGPFERDVAALGSSAELFELDVALAPGSSTALFERDVAAASGPSAELFERDVVSAPGLSVGLFERDVASSPAVGPLDFASSSSSGSSNVMVVQVDVHREESSEDTIVDPNLGDGGNDEKSLSSGGSDDEPER
ncbi:uncharacterized protein LOC118193959 [Stegodyphus dumicola]|uniref:uncharacterized protein LOC118193959 n=1 Tax=Stegodyphus dumicola TaxID=202533 RepID=UPI0015B0C6CA|nr:uncharacterized protein LOC118193959 [Stegodyphus dumicola]